MIELEAIDRFHIESAGHDVFTVRAPYEMNRDKPEITGEMVRIKLGTITVTGRVKAVDRFLPAYPIRVGEVIGLAVVIQECDVESFS